MSEYREFKIKSVGRSYIGERPIPEQRAIYRLVGNTLRELLNKIDDWQYRETFEGSFLGPATIGV